MSFLRWVGGKRKILNHIIPLLKPENNNNEKCYIEPFLGSGSVLINLLQSDFKYDVYICSDLNEKLIITFNEIKYNIKELINQIEIFQSDFNRLDDDEKKKEFYYKLRDEYNNEKVNNKIAAEFIVLNKLCFRGLYHVNKSNQFDSAYGYNKYHKFVSYDLLLNLNELFNKHNVHFFHSSYQDWKNNFKLVCNDEYEITMYLDPPYYNTFDKYTSMGFDNNEFIEFLKNTKSEVKKLIVSNVSGFENLIEPGLFENILNIGVTENLNPKFKRTVTRNEIILY